MQPYTQALPYSPDSTLLFNQLVTLPWSIFLDSARPRLQGRYDILSANPKATLTTHGDRTILQTASKQTEYITTEPFAIAKHYITQHAPQIEEACLLPFCGGLMGYFGYELGQMVHQQDMASQSPLPDMALGYYEWAIVVDHKQQQTTFVHCGEPAEAQVCWTWLQLYLVNTHPTPSQFKVTSRLKSNFDPKTYATAFKQVKQHIHAGDCYQVNLAQRFNIGVTGSSWSLYKTIRTDNPAPYSSFMQLPQGAILSFSPERFLRIKHRRVTTEPIKGTRPRGPNADRDQILAEQLITSVKDRAENIMIVDLMRNDLGKHCKVGSVQVQSLCQLITFPTIHHLVSTVSGELETSTHPLDVFRDCFPGGSITGAPKLRVMDIIKSLEPHPRSVYCGAIGYISLNGHLDMNIAIRTLVHTAEQLYCWAGGGIVHDSDESSEYQETFFKVERILNAILGRSLEHTDNTLLTCSK